MHAFEYGHSFIVNIRRQLLYLVVALVSELLPKVFVRAFMVCYQCQN